MAATARLMRGSIFYPSVLVREMSSNKEIIFNSAADFLRGRLGLYLDYKEDSHKKGPDTVKITDFAWNIDHTTT